jgi:hypothetical protein
MRYVIYGFFFAICSLAAILFAKHIGIFLIIGMAEILAILVVADLMYQNVPRSLAKASRENYFRVDGTFSTRRRWLERNAKAKIYSNMLAVLALVVVAGNLVVLLIDTSVLPMSLAKETMALFTPNLDTWRDRVKESNLDADYTNWRATGDAAFSAFPKEPNFVKTTFPAMIGFVLFWLICSMVLVTKTYRISLSQYAMGIRLRSKEFMDQDLGRLQSHQDFADAPKRGVPITTMPNI